MALILIPEFLIHDTLTKALAMLRDDYNSLLVSSQENDSIIVNLLKDIEFQKLDILAEGLKIFVENDSTHPREIQVDTVFNMEISTPPCITITIPGDSPAVNSIGIGENELGAIYDTDEGVNPDQSIKEPSPNYFQTYNRRYKATYDLVIHSDNSNEVVLIYHVVRALLTGLTTHLHQNKLQNLQISGQDISIYSEVVPRNFFTRVLRLSFEYETGTMNLFKKMYPKDILFPGTIVE